RITDEIRLNELALVDGDVVDLVSLKAANLIRQDIKRVKVILSGEINKPVTVRGLGVTKGALAAIEAAGGKVES
ncbi:MAG: 50S ribosomal protein L15, partial [Gammaproteobacteria bacterium]|nr:50S ribosomal protein L15 [Gammaproteobacteria bacterium]